MNIYKRTSHKQKMVGRQLTGQLRMGRMLAGFLLLCCSSLASAAENVDTIVIDAGADKQTKVAIVPFSIGRGVTAQAPMEGIVEFDLARTGLFDVLERENMLSLPSKPSEVLFRDWKILGMEYVVIGDVEPSSGGQALNLYIFDVVNERQLFAKRISGAQSNWRDVAHAAADEVFTQITGIPGAFSTKLMYVLATGIGTPAPNFQLQIADSDLSLIHI